MPDPVKLIEILGPGCARCRETHRVVRHVVDEAGLDCRVVKDESIDRLVALGILGTPAVVVDGKVVVTGRIPKTAEIRRLLGLE